MSRPILPESAYEALGLDSETIKNLMNPKPPVEPTQFAAPNLLQSDEDNAAPMGPNETAITLYAELLLNIRTISLFASLRTHHSRETKAKLSSDGNSITVSHEGKTATIHMPFNVKGGGDAELSLPSHPPSKEITLRLQLEEKDGSDLLGSLQGEERRANIVPWDGAWLDKETRVEVRCKSCDHVIVPQGTIGQWKDLPNENWAEMMDFWHCHKPDEHHLHDHAHEDAMGQKGYAAGNRLRATQGLGFVDLTSFLLKDEDCEGAQLVSKDTSQESFVVCGGCRATLGTQDEPSDGWRIWKWNLDIRHSSSPQPHWHVYSTQKWISARLLYLIENTALRKFHIHPVPPTTTALIRNKSAAHSAPLPSLLVWVFTLDLLFSSSIPSTGRRDPTRSMKVFYQKQTWKPLEPGEPESASIDDVELPEELFEELDRVLGDSQNVLPPTARKFKEWDVGLLHRFDIGDVAATHTDQAPEKDASVGP